MPDLAVIIPSLNTCDLTVACVQSVVDGSALKPQIIVVDGGSHDRTIPALRENFIGPVMLDTAKNLGYAGACNAGARLADPAVRALIFLNSDCVVAPGWDEILVGALGGQNGHRIGATGPMSNNVSGCQHDPEAQCDTPAELEAYAARRRDQYGGRVEVVPRLTGMCLCISREAWEDVGPFDERFYPGNFDDDDWGWRAKEKGWLLGLCPGAFVHHVGQATFRANDIDYGAALAENRDRFEQKWRGARAGPWADS